MARVIGMRRLPYLGSAAAICGLSLTVGATPLQDQKADKPQERGKRPRITLKAQPTVGRAPMRSLFSAELVGGSDDFEEYYCPTVSWEWSRGNASQSSSDCEPYEEGKSVIRRRYSAEHTFRYSGTYRVYFSLSRQNKEVGTAFINIVVQPGAGEP
jgi:hypothetical protein